MSGLGLFILLCLVVIFYVIYRKASGKIPRGENSSLRTLDERRDMWNQRRDMWNQRRK